MGPLKQFVLSRPDFHLWVAAWLAFVVTIIVLVWNSSRLPKLPPPRKGPKALGLNVEGVIATKEGCAAADGALEKNGAMSPLDGAVDAVKQLVKAFGSDNVYLLCVTNRSREQAYRDWFQKERFLEELGVKQSHMIFLRLKEQKGEVIRRCSITHFIDIRDKALVSLVPLRRQGLVQKLVLLDSTRQPSRPTVIGASSWKEAQKVILAE